MDLELDYQSTLHNLTELHRDKTINTTDYTKMQSTNRTPIELVRHNIGRNNMAQSKITKLLHGVPVYWE